MSRFGGSRVRAEGRRLFVWLVAALVVAAALGLVAVGDPYRATEGSVEGAAADDVVTVESGDRGYVLRPADGESTVGLVFYPGGLVRPEAYVGSLAGLVRRTGITVVIPRMPANLAVFDYGLARLPGFDHAADGAMARTPEVDRWYVGGHSLGGAMACRYAADHPDRVEGVVLYAAYCDADLSGTDLSALAVTGSADGVIDRGAFERNRGNLPAGARVEELAGLNHTQFGSYTGQDDPSGTAFATAHERLNELVAGWIENETVGRIRPTPRLRPR